MEVSASRTAPTFGFRVLPTATLTVFELEFISETRAIVLADGEKIHRQFGRLRKTSLRNKCAEKECDA